MSAALELHGARASERARGRIPRLRALERAEPPRAAVGIGAVAAGDEHAPIAKERRRLRARDVVARLADHAERVRGRVVDLGGLGRVRCPTADCRRSARARPRAALPCASRARRSALDPPRASRRGSRSRSRAVVAVASCERAGRGGDLVDLADRPADDQHAAILQSCRGHALRPDRHRVDLECAGRRVPDLGPVDGRRGVGDGSHRRSARARRGAASPHARYRACARLPAGENVRVAGSQSSAAAIAAPSGPTPPVTSTRPSSSRVAVCRYLAVASVPAACQVAPAPCPSPSVHDHRPGSVRGRGRGRAATRARRSATARSTTSARRPRPAGMGVASRARVPRPAGPSRPRRPPGRSWRPAASGRGAGAAAPRRGPPRFGIASTAVRSADGVGSSARASRKCARRRRSRSRSRVVHRVVPSRARPSMVSWRCRRA